MVVGASGRDKKIASLRLRRAGALLFALGVIAGLFWWIRNRIDPGGPVVIVLERPRKNDVLRPGRPVDVSGLVKGAKGPVICNGVKADTADGHFLVKLDGSRGPGLFVLDCHARNERGTTYHVRYGRLVGWTAPMMTPMKNAVMLTIPLSLLNDDGGLLGEVNSVLRRQLLPLLTTKGTLAIGPYRLGPAWVSDVRVYAVTTTVSGRVDFHLVFQRPCIDVGLGSGSTTHVCLPIGFHAKLSLSMSSDGRLVLHMGRLDTKHLRSSSWLAGIDLAATAAGMISERLGRIVAWPASAAKALTGALDKAKKMLEDRLSALALLIPSVPATWSRAGSRICLDVSLSKLETNPVRDTATMVTNIRIRGYDPQGRCKVVRPFSKGAWRLLSDMEEGAKGARSPTPDEALLLLSSSFVNAYLSALWWMGALEHISLENTHGSALGFSLESLDMGLPPAFLPGKYLRLVVPEAGVWVKTVGEPKRYFVVSASVDVRLLLSSAGLELALMDSPLPQVSLRCSGELGNAPCVEQTQRYQNMVDIVLEMVKSGGLVLPILPVAKALPVWKTKFVELRPAWVRRWRGGIGIGLDVTSIGTSRFGYGLQQSVQTPPFGVSSPSP